MIFYLHFFAVRTPIFSQPKKNGSNTTSLFYSACQLTCHANSIKCVRSICTLFSFIVSSLFKQLLIFFFFFLSFVFVYTQVIHCKRRRSERSVRFRKWQSIPLLPPTCELTFFFTFSHTWQNVNVLDPTSSLFEIHLNDLKPSKKNQTMFVDSRESCAWLPRLRVRNRHFLIFTSSAPYFVRSTLLAWLF